MSVKPAGLLRDLSDAERQALAECGKRVVFRADQELLRQGEHNASLYLVEDGILHVRRDAKGHKLMLGRLEAGSFFGEVSLFDPGPTTATVYAVTDGSLIELTRPRFDQFRSRCPAAGAQILFGILAQMATRLRRTNERLVDSVVWGGLLK